MKIDMKKALYCLLGLTFLQDSSADVTKLRLNQNVMGAFQGSNECSYNDIHFVKIINGNNDFIFDTESHLVKDQYKNAIFCNENGEIFISLSSKNKILPEDMARVKKAEFHRDFDLYKHLVNCSINKRRQNEAKRQFENIIRSGLVVNNHFNDQIFNNPFEGNKWKMPGISADISDLTATNIPVMCAMKRDIQQESKNILTNMWNGKKFNDIAENTNVATLINKHKTEYKAAQRGIQTAMRNDILTAKKWFDILNNAATNFIFLATEHTERQLLMYHCLNVTLGDQWLSEYSNTGLSCNTTPFVNISAGSCNINASKHLLIYTSGAPCVDNHTSINFDTLVPHNNSDDNGRRQHNIANGGISCWDWYRMIANKMVNIDVYFSAFFKKNEQEPRDIQKRSILGSEYSDIIDFDNANDIIRLSDFTTKNMSVKFLCLE